MLQLHRREALSERMILRLSPNLKQRLFAKAATEGRVASDLIREAVANLVQVQ